MMNLASKRIIILVIVASLIVGLYVGYLVGSTQASIEIEKREGELRKLSKELEEVKIRLRGAEERLIKSEAELAETKKLMKEIEVALGNAKIREELVAKFLSKSSEELAPLLARAISALADATNNYGARNYGAASASYAEVASIFKRIINVENELIKIFEDIAEKAPESLRPIYNKAARFYMYDQSIAGALSSMFEAASKITMVIAEITRQPQNVQIKKQEMLEVLSQAEELLQQSADLLNKAAQIAPELRRGAEARRNDVNIWLALLNQVREIIMKS